MRLQAVPYVVPFGAFLVFLAVRDYLPFGPGVEYPLRVLAVTTVLLVFSRPVLSFRPSRPIYGLAFGIGVFAVWVLPDILWPAYRELWIFRNGLVGEAASTIPPDIRADPVFLIFRIAGTSVLVPIIEELFWRGWLMRYLIVADFRRVPLGTYSALSFWVTALLFASEHGPYWDVGLMAGVAYNWWMVRSGNLADCILAHAVTNACLAAYVVIGGAWQYWL